MCSWRYIVFALCLFFSLGAAGAQAQSINLSNDPAYAEQFSHYCPPYAFSFESGKHYVPTDRSCIYSIPTEIRAAGGRIVVTLYKGVPGSATRIRSEFVFDGSYFPTLMKVQDPGTFES